jgi:predicted nucleotidyltransferase
MNKKPDAALYAPRLNAMNRSHREEMAKRRDAARAEADRIAALFHAELQGLETVWAFGSAYENSKPFTEHSDIDLAIEGGNIIEAVKIAHASPFKVDVIDITGCSDDFARMIRIYGTRL